MLRLHVCTTLLVSDKKARAMTTQNTQQHPSSQPRITSEHILVVPRSVLEQHNVLAQGFVPLRADSGQETNIVQIITQHGQFHERELMEVDETYKQIIPYFVFKHAGKLFLMQRSGKASEQRL